MTSTRKWSDGWDLEIYHVFEDSIVFKQWIYCFTFADGVGMGLIIWLLFADVIG